LQYESPHVPDHKNPFKIKKIRKTLEHHQIRLLKEATPLEEARPVYNLPRPPVPPTLHYINSPKAIHKPQEGVIPPNAAKINGIPAQTLLQPLVPDKRVLSEWVQSMQKQPFETDVDTRNGVQFRAGSQANKIAGIVKLEILNGNKAFAARNVIRNDDVLATVDPKITGPGAPTVKIPKVRFQEVQAQTQTQTQTQTQSQLQSQSQSQTANTAAVKAREDDGSSELDLATAAGSGDDIDLGVTMGSSAEDPSAGDQAQSHEDDDAEHANANLVPDLTHDDDIPDPNSIHTSTDQALIDAQKELAATDMGSAIPI